MVHSIRALMENSEAPGGLTNSVGALGSFVKLMATCGGRVDRIAVRHDPICFLRSATDGHCDISAV